MGYTIVHLMFALTWISFIPSGVADMIDRDSFHGTLIGIVELGLYMWMLARTIRHIEDGFEMDRVIESMDNEINELKEELC